MKNKGGRGGIVNLPPAAPVPVPRFFLKPVNGAPRVLFKSGGIISGDPFVEALRMTGSSREAARSFFWDANGYDGTNSTYKRIIEFCRTLITDDADDMTAVSQVTFLLNQRKVEDSKIRPQMLHTDFTAEKIKEMQECRVWPFFAIIPLTDEGSWLMVTPTFDRKSETPPKTQMVFIPKGNALVLPGTTIHAGGFNTGSRGNPRLHITMYLYDTEYEKEALEVIGDGDFVSEWIGFKEVESDEEVEGDETRPVRTQPDETQLDETQREDFSHTFVAVDWDLPVKRNRAAGKRKANEVVKLPNIPIPNNPNLDPRLYDLKHVTALMDFIGH